MTQSNALRSTVDCCFWPDVSLTVADTYSYVYVNMKGNSFTRTIVLSPKDALAFARQMEQIALKLIEKRKKDGIPT